MTTTLIPRRDAFLLAAGCGLAATTPPALGVQEPGGEKVKVLLKERLAALREVADLTDAAARAGTVPYERAIDARLAVFAAELELCSTDAERVKVLEKAVAEAKRIEADAEKAVKNGTGHARVAWVAKARRLEAEIALERAKPVKRP